MKRWLSILALALAGQTAPAAAEAGKFRVDGDTLVYDTESPGPGEDTGIVSGDVDRLLELLRGTEGLARLQLNSSGGEVYAATQMSDIVVDFELDTHVHGDCDSSCVTIFLGGARRTMSRGSRIGFHQIFWSAENISSYYDREREEQGWQSPWDFAAWMYLDTQEEMYAHLTYIVSRGVDPGFAIETIKNPQAEMWRPRRRALIEAGVLTE